MGEARQRNGLRDGISSEHKSIYAKLNEHSTVASDLQRQIETNERSMRGKFIDHDSTQQSLRECTQRLADNQKSVDDKVNNLIIGVSPASAGKANCANKTFDSIISKCLDLHGHQCS